MPICAIYLELLSKLGILLKEIEKKKYFNEDEGIGPKDVWGFSATIAQ